MMQSIVGAVAALCSLLAGDAAAQTNYPEQTVRILVGFPAGTAPDVAARIVADKFAQNWGKPVVVENITGASGNIAVDRVAKSQRDGYTLLMGGNSSLIMSVSLTDKLPFDPVKDFAPISRIFVAANLLVVHPDVPAKSIEELVALARAKPGELTYGHTGPGPRNISPANCSSHGEDQHSAGGVSRLDRGAARSACRAISRCRSATWSTPRRWCGKESCAPSR